MVDINPIILKLSASKQKKWIAARKKAKPNVDWEGALQKLKDEYTPISEESEKD